MIENHSSFWKWGFWPIWICLNTYAPPYKMWKQAWTSLVGEVSPIAAQANQALIPPVLAWWCNTSLGRIKYCWPVHRRASANRQTRIQIASTISSIPDWVSQSDWPTQTLPLRRSKNSRFNLWRSRSGHCFLIAIKTQILVNSTCSSVPSNNFDSPRP